MRVNTKAILRKSILDECSLLHVAPFSVDAAFVVRPPLPRILSGLLRRFRANSCKTNIRMVFAIAQPVCV
jgi:hypothetical protein